jgi:hypothetical protein
LQIPLKLRLPLILKKIQSFSIVKFQDNNLINPSPHWYVLIPVPDKSSFLIAMITSKIDKLIAYYRRTKKPKAADSLVKISNDEFSFLKHQSVGRSVVNCNETECLDISELVHRIDETAGFKIEPEKVPEYLRKEIVSAILNSPMTSPFMHRIAKAANPMPQ